jgi:hypothetical protein
VRRALRCGDNGNFVRHLIAFGSVNYFVFARCLWFAFCSEVRMRSARAIDRCLFRRLNLAESIRV